MKNRRDRLSADDWCAAALDVIAEYGVDCLAVEPLAKRLHVTKGSFYWHFTNREALLVAALDLWARQMTDEVMARAREEPDARARIRRLFREVDGAGHVSRLYTALLTASHDPEVCRVIEDIALRGMQFLHDCYSALGLSPEATRHYTTLAYSTFLGTLQLRRDVPKALPNEDAFTAYMDFIEDRLLPSAEHAEVEESTL